MQIVTALAKALFERYGLDDGHTGIHEVTHKRKAEHVGATDTRAQVGGLEPGIAGAAWYTFPPSATAEERISVAYAPTVAQRVINELMPEEFRVDDEYLAHAESLDQRDIDALAEKEWREPVARAYGKSHGMAMATAWVNENFEAILVGARELLEDKRRRESGVTEPEPDARNEQTDGLQRRFLAHTDSRLSAVETRRSGTPGAIAGYAVRYTFDSHDLGGFVERIRKGAFDESLAKVSRGEHNVNACLEHEGGVSVLGSTRSGTLKLETNDIGLRYTVHLPDTSIGRDVQELVRRGDLAESSFAFTVSEGGEEWIHHRTPALRIITSATLFDVSVVSRGAYGTNTSVGIAAGVA